MESLFGQFREILPVVNDLSAFFDRVPRENAEHGFRRDRFPGARFAHDRERFALIKVEIDPSYRLYFAVFRAERDFQVFDGQFDFFTFHGFNPPFLSERG